MPSDLEARVEAQAGLIWAQACTGKFVWPIPDKGLKKRIHRIATPTLIVWGRTDGVIPPVYAEEFARRIANSRVALIDAAGHVPHLEQAEHVGRRWSENFFRIEKASVASDAATRLVYPKDVQRPHRRQQCP